MTCFFHCILQVVTGNMPGMTHISFRPGGPGTKVLERPQKIPDARLLTGVPVNRLLRPAVPITITTLSSSVLSNEPVVNVSQSAPEGNTAGTPLQPKTDSKVQIPEKKVPETLAPSVTESQTKKAVPAVQTCLSQEIIVTSVQGSTVHLAPKSPARKESSPKNVGQGGTNEGKKGEGTEPGGTSESTDFDAMKVMDWSDGIASLPGSNLKVRYTCVQLLDGGHD